MNKVAVLCIKYGNKYDDAYVYNLLRMVKKNTNYQFDFFCYSDNEILFNDNAAYIPLNWSFEHEGVWNKLRLFSDKLLDRYERKIYFDLDIVIQQNIDILFEMSLYNLTIIKSLWKPETLLLDKQEKDTLYNSSIMVWKDAYHIHDRYMSSPDIFMLTYKGIDRFFWYEPIEVDTLPPGIVYSFKHGPNLLDNIKLKYREQYNVCIFNQYPKITQLPTEHPLRLIWEGKL
jgi:hypothetical protein